MQIDHTIKDSIQGGWVERAPVWARPYLRLSRYDRPIGFWLLCLPGWIGLAFADMWYGVEPSDFTWAVLIALGAVAMRGAGCTYNDIIDRKLDAKVDRTALRPLPAGTVTLKQAWIWLLWQSLIGLIVLYFFPPQAQIIALGALILVAAYPFMKRITFWPQGWLGLTFNWAVLVAYSAKTGGVAAPLFILYAGLVFWTIGYDTIYACQDVEDDAMIGVKSTARLFGDHVKLGVGLCYALCVGLVALATVWPFFFAADGIMETSIYRLRTPLLVLSITPFAAHLLWQCKKLNSKNADQCLSLFKSNLWAGLWLALSFLVAALTQL